MHCQSCEHDNPPNSRYCNQCGRALQSRAPVSYTPRHLRERILAHGSAMAGERKPVTILFVDVVDSVALSELVGAEKWHQWLDRFFACLSTAVHAYEGTINQFTGDGIMALFGAPLALERHADMAARASLRIASDVARLAAEFEREHQRELQIRQGLNSGDVVVAAIGDDLRMDYTAKGQTTALAARLEAMARPGSILLSGFCARLLGPEFELERLRTLNVKGVSEPVPCFRLQGLNQGSAAVTAELPFVGRETELSLLQSHARQAWQGQGMAVWISGETGSGKGRLLREFRRWLQEDSSLTASVWWVVGEPHHRADPWLPFRQLLLSILGLGPDSASVDVAQALGDKGALAKPTNGTDLAAWLAGGEVASGRADDFMAEQALQWLESYIEAGFVAQPGVLMLKNLHELEQSACRHLIQRLVQALPDSHWLLVASYRSAWNNPYVATIESHELALSALTATECARLLEQMIGGDEALAGLRQYLLQHAAGNPLYLQEAVRELIGRGVLEQTRRGWVLRGEVSALPLPASIFSAISARIDALEPSRKQLLQRMAVVGQQVSLDLLQALTGESGATLNLWLKDLVAQQLIRAQRAATPTWVFARPVVQEACYRGLLDQQRQDLHHAVASAMRGLEPEAPEQLALIAEHYAAAGDHDAAALGYLSAARAIHWLRTDQAARYYEWAARSAAQAHADEAEVEAHCGRLRCQMLLGDDKELIESLRQRMQELIQTAKNLSGEVRAEWALMWQMLLALRLDGACAEPNSMDADARVAAALCLALQGQPSAAQQRLQQSDRVELGLQRFAGMLETALHYLLGRPYAGWRLAGQLAVGDDAVATLAGGFASLWTPPDEQAQPAMSADEAHWHRAGADTLRQIVQLIRAWQVGQSAETAVKTELATQMLDADEFGSPAWPLLGLLRLSYQALLAGRDDEKSARSLANEALELAKRVPLTHMLARFLVLAVAVRSRRLTSNQRRTREQLKKLDQELEQGELRLLQVWMDRLWVSYWRRLENPERLAAAEQRLLARRREIGLAPTASAPPP